MSAFDGEDGLQVAFEHSLRIINDFDSLRPPP